MHRITILMRGSVLLLSANKQRQYQQRKMFLKLTLIGMAFVPFIAGIQLETPTRVGKFLGWLSGKKVTNSVDSTLLSRLFFVSSEIPLRDLRFGF